MELTRRAFVAAITATALARADEPWADLFNGRDLTGWRPSENGDSWNVVEGHLVANGPRSHLYYSGPVRGADFRNFELEMEVLTEPGSRSGLFFHTGYQPAAIPTRGLSVQIANTPGVGTASAEMETTGSLRGRRHVYKQLAVDGDWFQLSIAVTARTVQVKLGNTLLVDYTEPSPAVIPSSGEPGRILGHGTFALACLNRAPKVRFRNIRVRPLPDDLPGRDEAPAVDDVYRQILELSAHGYPLIDHHVHLKEGLTLDQALAKSQRDGIQYGIAVNCGKGFPIETDAGARDFFESMLGKPVFIAMQAEGREWTRMFSRRAVSLFDYVFTDSMTWTDDTGKRMRLWIPEEVGSIADPQTFMDTLVARAVGILEHEAIDIYVNPTFLPDVIAKDYDRLWTESRMQKVVRAAAENQVAIEINDRYKLPSPAFLCMAKEAKCKFAFGTNNAGPSDLRRSEYGIQMIAECQLMPQDFFIPGAWWPKAVARKPGLLRASGETVPAQTAKGERRV